MNLIISWLLFGVWIIATCNGSALKKPVKPDRFKIEHRPPSPEEFTLPSRTSTLPPREFHSSWDNEEPSVSRTAGLAPSYPSLISVIFNRWSQASNKNAIEDNLEYEDEDEESSSSSGRSKRDVDPKAPKKKPRCLASLFGFGGDSFLDSPPSLPDVPDYGSPSPFGAGGNLQGGIVSPGLGSSLGYPSQSQYTPGYSTSGLGSGLGRPSSQYSTPGLGLGSSSGSGLGVPSQYTPGLGLASDALKNSQSLESQLYGSQYNINSQLGGIPNSGIPQSPSGFGFRAFEPALGMVNSFIQILGSAAGRAIRDYSYNSYSNGGNFPNFQLLQDFIRPAPSSINSLPAPPSIDFLPPPRGIKSLPPPQSVGSLPPPQSVGSLPSPPSIDYLPPPP